MQSDNSKRGIDWGTNVTNGVHPMQRDVRLVEVTDEELDMLRGIRKDHYIDHQEDLCRFVNRIEDTPVKKG